MLSFLPKSTIYFWNNTKYIVRHRYKQMELLGLKVSRIENLSTVTNFFLKQYQKSIQMNNCSISCNVMRKSFTLKTEDTKPGSYSIPDCRLVHTRLAKWIGLGGVHWTRRGRTYYLATSFETINQLLYLFSASFANCLLGYLDYTFSLPYFNQNCLT